MNIQKYSFAIVILIIFTLVYWVFFSKTNQSEINNKKSISQSTSSEINSVSNSSKTLTKYSTPKNLNPANLEFEDNL
jgi:hypothetical protein